MKQYEEYLHINVGGGIEAVNSFQIYSRSLNMADGGGILCFNKSFLHLIPPTHFIVRCSCAAAF